MIEKVKFSDFRIIPDINSVRREAIDDDTYFSKAYSGYISNSRLKWIDPNDGGTPQLFKSPPKLKTSSLTIGSRIHELLLQPESFELAPKLGKPSAKLGDVMDFISDFLKDEIGLDESIKQAAIKADYYVNSIDTKIEAIKEAWNDYSSKLNELISTDKTVRVVSDKDWDVINGCVESCNANPDITNLLHPIGNVESYCEDAFFMDYIVLYKNKYCATLKFKMKADNWTIDFENKVVTLNDLKTTSHPVQNFMKTDIGSFSHYSYARQMAVYSQILWYYCMKNYGVSKNIGWSLKANMLVVETISNYWSKAYVVNPSQLKDGHRMLNELLCRVGYYDIFGWDKEIQFE